MIPSLMKFKQVQTRFVSSKKLIPSILAIPEEKKGMTIFKSPEISQFYNIFHFIKQLWYFPIFNKISYKIN